MKNLIFFSLIILMSISCDPIDPTIVLKKYTVTAVAEMNGSIYPLSIVVEEGKEATFTIIPDDGFIIDILLIDGISVPSSNMYTMYKVKSDHSMSVSFKPKEGTPLWYLQQGHWYSIGSKELYSEGTGPWVPAPTGLRVEYIFYSNMMNESLWNDEKGKGYGNKPYSLNQKSKPMILDIILITEIVKLDKDSLIFITHPSNEPNVNVKEFYSHTKN